nr:MAG TPA: major coat protein [Inoviridae sp.]
MSEGMTTAVDTAFKAIKSDVSGMMTTALPVALAIVGIGLAITLGVKFFKKISSKS